MATQLAEQRLEIIQHVLYHELGTGHTSWKLYQNEYHFQRNGDDRDGGITCTVSHYNTDHRLEREKIGVMEQVGLLRIEPDGTISRFDRVPAKILRSVQR